MKEVMTVFEELLPKHLRGILDIDDERSDDGSVYGSVKCEKCGHTDDIIDLELA